MKITEQKLREVIKSELEMRSRINETLESFLTLGLTKAVFVLLAQYGLKRRKEKAEALRKIADEIEK